MQKMRDARVVAEYSSLQIVSRNTSPLQKETQSVQSVRDSIVDPLPRFLVGLGIAATLGVEKLCDGWHKTYVLCPVQDVPFRKLVHTLLFIT